VAPAPEWVHLLTRLWQWQCVGVALQKA
jgi:hypothetical protein